MQEATLKDLYDHIKPKFRFTKLISVGFGIILISWLLSQLDWSATLDILRDVPPSLLLLGFLCYAASFYLRALRFRILLPQETPMPLLFPIVLVHYTALNIIPARLGEVSYVYLLKKIDNVSLGHSVSSLLIARIFDQIAISLLFLLSSCFVELSSQWLKTLNIIVAVMLSAILAGLIIVLSYKERFIRWLKKVIVRRSRGRYPFVQKIFHVMDEIAAAFKCIQITQHVERIFGLSLLIWLGIFSVNYFLLKAVGVNLSFFEIILASTFLILLTMLPFQVISGIGIRETTWVFIALTMEVSRDLAITSALSTRILSTLFLCIFGGYGLFRLRDALKLSSAPPLESQPYD